MRKHLFLFVLVMLAGVAYAQVDRPADQSTERTGPRFRNETTVSSSLAYGSFSLSGEDRFGPVFTIQYSPNRYSRPAIDLFAGVLLQTGSSNPIDERQMVPLMSYVAPYYSPFSDYRNDNYHRSPNFSIGLAFAGTDITFYLLDGQVRPYVGIGGSLAFWSYSNRFSGTITPDAKAGVDVRVSSSFSGYAEVRRMFGVPNLFGWNTPKFDGLTSAAIGVSFAPRLR